MKDTNELTEPYRLANDTSAAKPNRFDTSEPRRQMVLFSGLDCLPGQLGLFPTDGSTTEKNDEHPLDQTEIPAERGTVRPHKGRGA